MRHEIEPGRALYAWRLGERWHRLEVTTQGQPELPDPESEATFITEHYWGYAAQRDGGTMEYQVGHPPWRVWRASSYELDCDVRALYGEGFGALVRVARAIDGPTGIGVLTDDVCESAGAIGIGVAIRVDDGHDAKDMGSADAGGFRVVGKEPAHNAQSAGGSAMFLAGVESSKEEVLFLRVVVIRGCESADEDGPVLDGMAGDVELEELRALFLPGLEKCGDLFEGRRCARPELSGEALGHRDAGGGFPPVSSRQVGSP